MSGKEQGGAIPATRTASREMSRFLEESETHHCGCGLFGE